MAERAAEPLAIWPWPLPSEQLEVVRSAFAAMGAPFPVVPSPAAPGGPVRVLAMGSLPPFACNSALIGNPLSFDSVTKGLRWVLDPAQDLENGHTMLDYLRLYLGAEVKELENDGSEIFTVSPGSKSRVAFR